VIVTSWMSVHCPRCLLLSANSKKYAALRQPDRCIVSESQFKDSDKHLRGKIAAEATFHDIGSKMRAGASRHAICIAQHQAKHEQYKTTQRMSVTLASCDS
jgi:hypothetical protein